MLGAILIVGGILAAVWPGVTLFTLALITGTSLIVHGAARIGLAVSALREIPNWGWAVSNRVSRRQAGRWSNQTAREEESAYPDGPAALQPAPLRCGGRA